MARKAQWEILEKEMEKVLGFILIRFINSNYFNSIGIKFQMPIKDLYLSLTVAFVVYWHISKTAIFFQSRAPWVW